MAPNLMAPNLQELFSWGALVAFGHVSGLSVRLRMTAGLDGFRGARPYQLVGTGIPLRRSGLSRSVGWKFAGWYHHRHSSQPWAPGASTSAPDPLHCL